MRRALLALAAAVSLASASGCSDSPCQELGEKLCACTGAGDACESQVEAQLEGLDDLTDARCEAVLNACNGNQPGGSSFCEWLLTEDGKQSCGLAPAP